jgi:hypothetical protein
MSSSVTREQQKADFMEHMFESYKPSNNCYTGLWERFCISEAGPYCRDMYYERLAALKEYLATQSPQESNDN